MSIRWCIVRRRSIAALAVLVCVATVAARARCHAVDFDDWLEEADGAGFRLLAVEDESLLPQWARFSGLDGVLCRKKVYVFLASPAEAERLLTLRHPCPIRPNVFCLPGTVPAGCRAILGRELGVKVVEQRPAAMGFFSGF